MKGRKSGCPTNIRDWQVSILDTDTDKWVRIQGLRTLTRSTESQTADGSAGSDLWEEPYVTKRSAVLKLSGKAVGCIASGEMDEGQSLLDSYAKAAGCQGDAAIRFADPYGHALEADYIVAATEQEADDNENTVSWELRQVGEAVTLPYKAVKSVTLSQQTAALRCGETGLRVNVAFAPEDASNRRYKIQLQGKRFVAVTEVDEAGFTVTALEPGEATVTVISLNGQKTAALTVTAEE